MKTVRLVVTATLFVALCGSASAEGHRISAVKIPAGGYFDTGFIPKNSPRVRMFVARHSEASSAGTCDLFGTAKTGRTAGCFVLNDESNTYYYRYGAANNSGGWSHKDFGGKDAWTSFVCDTDLVVNRKKVGTANASGTGDFSGNTTDTMCVPGYQTNCRKSMSIAHFALEDGGEVVRDLVAWQENGTNGLYDVKHATFYPMLGADATLAEETTAPHEVRDCVWLGGSGRWSDADKWQDGVLPEDGDYVEIRASEPTEITDIPAITLARISSFGGGDLTLRGDTISLKDPLQSLVATNECFVTFDVPLHFLASSTFVYRKGADVLKPVMIDDDVTLGLAGPGGQFIHFYDTVTGPKATIKDGNGNTSYVHLHAPINVRFLQCGDWNNFSFTCYASGNQWQTNSIGYWSRIEGRAVNAFPTNMVMIHRAYYAGNTTAGDYYQFDCDQTIDRFVSDPPVVSGTAYKQHFVKGSNDAVLTLRGTQDATTYAQLEGAFALVWDPVGDYTQRLVDRTHTITGPLCVRNGTLSVGGAASLKNVREVFVGKTGRFVIEAGTPNPFADAAVDLDIQAGGTVSVPEGVTLRVKNLFVNGELQPAGDYTGPALTGGGSVTTAPGDSGETFWNKPASGEWGDEANWSPRSPDETQRVFVQASGASYAVRVVEDAGTITNLTVGSCFGNEGFVTEVAVSNKLTLLSNHAQQNVPSLTVLKGGRFSVGEGGDVSLYPKSGTGSPNGNHVQFDIRNGGEFVVNGGYATVTNFGNASVGGKVFEPAATGVFRVASGTLNVWGRAWKNGLSVRPGGWLDTCGTGVLRISHTVNVGGLLMSGGLLTVRDQAKLLAHPQPGSTGMALDFADGTSVFSDSSTLEAAGVTDFSLTMRVRPLNEGKTATLTFRDHAKIVGNISSLYVGNTTDAACYKPNVARLELDSDAVHGEGRSIGSNAEDNDISASRLQVGTASSVGSVRITDGAFRVGGYGLDVGFSCDTNIANCASGTGVVEVAGGHFSVNGRYGVQNGYWGNGWQLYGSHFGYGRCAKLTSDRVCRGELVVSSGSFTNYNSELAFGIGNGEGYLRQTGGSIASGVGMFTSSQIPVVSGDYQQDKAFQYVRRATNALMMVGAFGGYGRVELTGGTCEIRNPVYVGGADTNLFVRDTWSNASTKSPAKWGSDAVDFARHDAEGLFAIGGTAVLNAAAHGFVVGYDGTGVVSVAGSACSVTCGPLTLLNGGENAEGAYPTSSTLVFTLDADGVAPIMATKFSVAPGAKLVVDATVCAKEGRVKLVDCKNCEGAFRTEDITLLGADWQIRQEPGRGLSIIKPRGIMFVVR